MFRLKNEHYRWASFFLYVVTVAVTVSTAAAQVPCRYPVPRTSDSGITCNFNISEESGKMYCPASGIIRVVGDYKVLSIRCNASFPIRFDFNGIRPTEAILVNSWKGIEEEPIIPQISSFFISVNVNSITRLAEYYSHAKNGTTGSLAFKYSRTGEYSFSEYFSNRTTTKHSYFIYFEEPEAEMALIRNSEIQLKYLNMGEVLLIPCITTHYNLSISLQTADGRSIREYCKSLYRDEARGFYCGVRSNSTSPDFTCTLSEKPSERITIGWNDRGKDVTGTQKTDINGDVHITFDNEYDGRIKALCRIDDEDGQVELRLIGARNYYEQPLVRDFVLPEFWNRSYNLVSGALINKCSLEWISDYSIPFLIGSTFCGDSLKQKAVSFSSGFSWNQKKIYPAAFRKDWATFPREDVEAQYYFKISSSSRNKVVFENETLTFSCWIHPAFSPPTVWLIYYDNGDVVRGGVDYENVDGISELTISVSLGMKEVMCTASLWYRNHWKNLSMSVPTVANSKPTAPSFGEQNPPDVFLSTVDPSPKIMCTAYGFPAPDISWSRIDQNGTQQLKDFITMKRKNRSVSTLKLSQVILNAIFICFASNSEGNATHLFKVKLISAVGRDGRYLWIPGGIALFLSVVGLSICLAVIQCPRKRKVKDARQLFTMGDFTSECSPTEAEVQVDEYGDSYPSLFPFDIPYEIDPVRFQLDESKCFAKRPYGSLQPGFLDGEMVAVKAVTTGEKSHLSSMLLEFKIQIYLGVHDNLVCLLGGCKTYLSSGKLYIFEEFCEFGTLKQYLSTHRADFKPDIDLELNSGVLPTLAWKDLFDWALQIASGMDYICQKRVIHRDLAAKHVLLDGNKTAKIAGFGSARRLYAYPEYAVQQGETLRWRWMALETLRDGVFSTKSDVWAYGITLWEIFSLGDVPYAEQTWNRSIITELEKGKVLQSPQLAPPPLYKMMVHCWNKDKEDRPAFAHIRNLLLQMMNLVPSTSL